MKNLQLHTPTGLNDLLPAAYQRKRNIERRIEAVFESYGYKFISSPALEYLEVFEGKGSIPAAEMYKLGDKNGDMLALRPDMTPAAVRIAVTHNLIEESPLRLCYIEKAFRDHERFQGRENEFTQAGAELMGVKSAEADAELIALAVRSLVSAGLTNFRVDIGEVNFLPGILSELKEALTETERGDFLRYMIRRDYVAAEKIAEKANHIVPAGVLLSDLSRLTGGMDILERAESMSRGEKALGSLRHLRDVYMILSDQDLAKHVLFDLSMTGQLDYYTGTIFKGYAKGSAATIVDGGRYDSMLTMFKNAESISAVGFGIKIDGLIEARGSDFTAEFAETLLAYHPSARKTALKTADMMREQGVKLENSLISGGLDAQKKYAAGKNLNGILYFDGNGKVLTVNLLTGEEQEADVDELISM